MPGPGVAVLLALPMGAAVAPAVCAVATVASDAAKRPQAAPMMSDFTA